MNTAWRVRALWLCPGLAVLGFVSCVAVPQEGRAVTLRSGEVRFEMTGPGGAALVLPVSINGQGPYPFVLDTGATLTCVDEGLAKELELPNAVGMVGVGGGVRGMAPMRIVKFESIELGTAKVTALNGCVLNLDAIKTAGLNAQGLLGLNFLKFFRVTIDFTRSTVQLQSPGESRDSTAP